MRETSFAERSVGNDVILRARVKLKSRHSVRLQMMFCFKELKAVEERQRFSKPQKNQWAHLLKWCRMWKVKGDSKLVCYKYLSVWIICSICSPKVQMACTWKHLYVKDSPLHLALGHTVRLQGFNADKWYNGPSLAAVSDYRLNWLTNLQNFKFSEEKMYHRSVSDNRGCGQERWKRSSVERAILATSWTALTNTEDEKCLTDS